MKLSYTTKNGRMTVELESDTQTGLWEELARFQEVFEDTTCRAKQKGDVKESDDVRFVVRENKDGDKFYELMCTSWESGLAGYKKAFGCHKKGGGLFPKRQAPEGENIIPGFNGWHKWAKDKESNGSAPSKEVAAETTEEVAF